MVAWKGLFRQYGQGCAQHERIYCPPISLPEGAYRRQRCDALAATHVVPPLPDILVAVGESVGALAVLLVVLILPDVLIALELVIC